MRNLLIAALLVASTAFADHRHQGGHRPHQHYGPRVDLLAVDRACRAAMYYGSDAQKCVELAARADFDATQVIAECDRAMYYDSEALSCIETALTARRDISPAIAACDRAMYYDSEVKTCVAEVAAAWYVDGQTASLTVAACDGAMYYDSDVRKCLQVALPLANRGPEVVQYCDGARYYDSEALSCISTIDSGGDADDCEHAEVIPEVVVPTVHPPVIVVNPRDAVRVAVAVHNTHLAVLGALLRAHH